MSLETYTGKIADLVTTNPTPTDPKSQGDDHLRGIKYTLQQTFPGFNGPVTDYLVKKSGDTMTGNLVIDTAGVPLVSMKVSGVTKGHLYAAEDGIGLLNNLGDGVFLNPIGTADVDVVGKLTAAGVVAPGIQANNQIGNFGNYNIYNSATRNSALMYLAGAGGTAAVAQLYRNNSTGSYTFELSDNTGVGTKTFHLALDGEAYKAVAGPWAGISDARKKNVLGEYNDGLEAVLSVRPVRYELKDSPERQHVGILAQDLLETPLGADCITEDSEGFYQYNGNALTYALVNAVKELSAKLDAAVAEIATLKAAK